MFEAVELGRKVTRDEFDAAEPELRTRLLSAQRQLLEAEVPIVIVVSGVEGAGKGRVVDRLSKWLDTREIQTHAFWDETDEERERPRYWRFWRALPPRGRISVLFGSWYTQPIVDHAMKKISKDAFEREIARIADFERMLIQDGGLIVKLWFHLAEKDQRKRLKEERKRRSSVAEADRIARRYSKRYESFLRTSERAIRATDSGYSPWHLVEARNKRYRDLTAGRTVLAAMEHRLENGQDHSETARPSYVEAGSSVLDRVDLTANLEEVEYKRRLGELQARFYQLAWQAYEKRRSTVLVFEGWDAAGKGSAIRRVTGAVDARLCRVISIAAPTDEERAQHYLWRFWRQLPRDGRITIFDRSWYGRVLVERIEGFATEAQWGRSYREINAFEEQLVDHGTLVLKFWIHISPEEQLRRFEERQEIPWKQYKITDEDWRNREKWSTYEAAVSEMVTRTSALGAPWLLIAGTDKKSARVTILSEICDRLEKAVAD